VQLGGGFLPQSAANAVLAKGVYLDMFRARAYGGLEAFLQNARLDALAVFKSAYADVV
jgi:hypothetical protein